MIKRENELMKKIKEYDQDAFNVLYGYYYPIICCYIRRLTNEYDTAEDLTQETFMKFMGNIHKYDEEKYDSAKPLLLYIARNITMDYIRNNCAHQCDYFDQGNHEILVAEVDTTMNHAWDDFILDGILEPDELSICMYKIKYNMKFSEISEMMNISSNVIKKKYAVALKKLKSYYSRDIIKYLEKSKD